MGALRDAEYDIAQVLNAGTADLSTQATLNGHVKDSQTDFNEEVVDLATVLYKLNITLSSITPIPPGQ
jgi:hypothetical protein